MTQQQIKCLTGPLGAGGDLQVYEVPGSVLVTPVSASVSFDGTGAAGAFIPCLTFKTQTGAIIARCPAPEVAQGDTAEVSWFPAGSLGGGSPDLTGYIRYGVGGNLGDTLSVVAIPGPIDLIVEPGDGTGEAQLHLEAPSGEGNVHLSGQDITDKFHADLYLDGQSSPQAVLGVYDDTDFTNAQIVITTGEFDADSGAIDLQAPFIRMSDLPTSDPGIGGMLWNSGGTLRVS